MKMPGQQGSLWDFLGMVIGCTSKPTTCNFCAAEILPTTRSKPSESRNGAKEMMLLPLVIGFFLMTHSTSSLNSNICITFKI